MQDPTKAQRLSPDNYALSWLIAQQTGAIWGHCYENAYPAFFAHPALFDPHGQFIEGWIVFEDQSRVVLMEHGWLVSNGGRIIDPTIVLTIECGEVVHYFPGVVRKYAELLTLEHELFPHVRFDCYGNDGIGLTSYRTAYEAARTSAQSLLSENKTFVEVRATMLEPGDEPSEWVELPQMPPLMLFVLPKYGEKHGKERL